MSANDIYKSIQICMYLYTNDTYKSLPMAGTEYIASGIELRVMTSPGNVIHPRQIPP